MRNSRSDRGRGVWLAAVLAVSLSGGIGVAGAQTTATIGTSFPEDFPEIVDHTLGIPVIGFGSAEGVVTRTPVIFLHGNNDTPYPTDCNGAFGKIQNFAQFFLDNGYSPRELWGLGYEGEQCDILVDPTQKSGEHHSTVANVPDLRAFVAAVLDYTGATQVDIVGHSLGTTVTREWLRQDDAYDTVRWLVAVDGPNHGIINCSPNPRNVWQYPPAGGFHPDSAICLEYGADDTPLLAALNAGDETPGPTRYLAIVNADASFVYYDVQDGLVPPVPAENRRGEAHDFSRSAWLDGAEIVEVTDQGAYDDALRAAHLGIVNSPEVWAVAFERLNPATEVAGAPTSPPTPDPAPPAPQTGAPLPATGAPAWAALGLVMAALAAPRRRR